MEGVRAHLQGLFNDHIDISGCQSLASATKLLSENIYDLAIIDMSIHSHEPMAGAGSPFPLSSGGLDVLFEIVDTSPDTFCIILTQYPDIEIESLPIPVELAQQAILENFSIKVGGCVRYLEDDNQWKLEIARILGKI